MMSDLIDRDALKKAIGKVYACDWDDIEKYFHIAEAVNSLPSVKPEPKWIPCSERLPDWNEHRDEMVLVCYGNGSIRFDTYMHDDWVHGNPIAWMPLPEPVER